MVSSFWKKKFFNDRQGQYLSVNKKIEFLTRVRNYAGIRKSCSRFLLGSMTLNDWLSNSTETFSDMFIGTLFRTARKMEATK